MLNSMESRSLHYFCTFVTLFQQLHFLIGLLSCLTSLKQSVIKFNYFKLSKICTYINLIFSQNVNEHFFITLSN